jgi:hypothetical protein
MSSPFHNSLTASYSKLYHLRFLFVSEGGVRLSPLGTSASIWLIAPAPDGDECAAVGGMSAEVF